MYDVIYFDLLLVHEFLFFSLNVRFILRSLQKNVKTDFIYEYISPVREEDAAVSVQ